MIRSALINDQGYGSSPPMRELISDFLVVQPMIDLLNAHASRADKKTFFYVLKDFDPLNTKAVLKKFLTFSLVKKLFNKFPLLLSQMDEISYIFSSSVYKWKYTGSPSHAYKLHPFVMLINLLANFVRNGYAFYYLFIIKAFFHQVFFLNSKQRSQHFRSDGSFPTPAILARVYARVWTIFRNRYAFFSQSINCACIYNLRN